jgi:ABC-type Na+ transport system ATPase subunit NatA
MSRYGRQGTGGTETQRILTDLLKPRDACVMCHELRRQKLRQAINRAGIGYLLQKPPCPQLVF